MLKEFKAFVMRGNVMDLAVGVIIGAAFGKIVGSLVDDVLMPVLGLLDRPRRLREPVRHAGRGDVRHDRRREEGRRGDAELRRLPQHDHRVPDRGVRDLHGGEADQPAEAARAGGAAPTTKDCPLCATAIPVAAKKCPNCTSASRG